MSIFEHPFFKKAPAFASLEKIDQPKPEHVRACLIELARYVLARVERHDPIFGPPRIGPERQSDFETPDPAELAKAITAPILESMREEIAKIDVTRFKTDHLIPKMPENSPAYDDNKDIGRCNYDSGVTIGMLRAARKAR